MFGNYLKVALRDLYKNRIFAVINILGLGLALAICIVAYFNYRFDTDFDRQHLNMDRIYRVTTTREIQGRQQEYGLTPNILARQVSGKLSQVGKICRYQRAYSPVRAGEEIIRKQVSFVDPEFLDIFTVALITGSSEAIHEMNNVLVSDDLAGILYGPEDPVGKSISIVNDEGIVHAFIVAGVFRKFPLNSSFQFDVLTNYGNFLTMWNVKDDDWKLWTTATFIMVNDATATGQIIRQLSEYIPLQNQAREDAKVTSFRMIPFRQVNRNTREIWNSGLYPGLHPAARIAPPIMAILILLIACFNFTNTSIAASGRRLREIGIRKVLGGQRRQIIIQFLTDNLLISFLALLLGVALAGFLVPAYSSLWDYMSLRLTFNGYPGFWLFLVLLLAVAGILAGSYPAFYISAFKPVSILYGKWKLGSASLLSWSLLTLQLIISVMALVSGFVFTKNAAFQETIDLGYDKDNLIVVPIDTEPDCIAFRNEVMKNPDISSVAFTEEHIGWGAYVRSMKNGDIRLEVDMMDIGAGYAETMGLRLVDGRLFSEERKEYDVSNRSVIVNRKLAESFGWENALGQRLVMYDTVIYTVTGVVSDFHAQGFFTRIHPTVLALSQGEHVRVMAVRAGKEKLPQVQEYLSVVWKSMFPNIPYGGMYQEETLAEARSINSSIQKVYIFLAVSAGVLSLIGLYTLVSLGIINRTKEVGIRKVLGSGMTHVVWVLSRRFIVVVTVSSVLGCLAAWYTCRGLMSSIWEVYTEITAGLFILAVLLIFFSAVLTIAWKVYIAASMNPSWSLRYE